MKFDTYTLFARAFPTLISAVPFFVFQYFFLSPALGVFWQNLLALEIASNATFSVGLFYLLLQIGRVVSKDIIEGKFYKNGLYFPTTNFLLHLDGTYSSQYTNRVHQKIRDDFRINIPSLEAERADSINSRKLISEAISHIRARVGKGNLVQQHNIEYGFYRNMAGGSIVAAMMSVANVIVFLWIYHNQTAFHISIVNLFTYGLFSLVSKRFIDKVGYSYARVLIQEYMSK